jgi:hypothetical protein
MGLIWNLLLSQLKSQVIWQLPRVMDLNGVDHEIVVYLNSHLFFSDIDPNVYKL